MTVSSEINSIPYAGNGVTVVFAFPYLFYNDADLLVLRVASDGTVTTLVLNVDYVVDGAGVSIGGTVTTTVAPASGTTLTITRSPAAVQESHYVSTQPFPSATVERGYDYLTMLCQRLLQRVKAAIHYPDGESNTDATLAPVSTRKGTYLFFDAVTGAISYALNLAVTTLTQAVIGGLLYPRTAAEIAAGVTPTNYAYAPYDVRRYGAVGNGSTDDTVAVQAALTAVPAGATVIIPEDHKITGAGCNLTTRSRVTITGGGRLKFVSANVDAVHILLSGTCDDVLIDNVRFEGDGNSGATYFQYGVYSFSGQTLSNIRIENCHFKNLNAAILFNADTSGTYTSAFALNNTIEDMVGTQGGQGYGIHCAKATNVHIRGNTVLRAQRHSIYCARASATAGDDYGVFIHDNIIRDHRSVGNGAARPAIFTARGYGVSIKNNKIINYFDGAIGAQQDTPTADNTGDVTIEGNEMFGRQNAVPSLWVGEQSNPTSYRISNVRVANNVFRSDYAVGGNASEISLYNGLGIDVIGNRFYVANIANVAYRPIVVGEQAAQGALDLDSVNILNNVMNGSISGAGYSPIRFVQLASPICAVPAGGAARIRIVGNEIDATLLNLMAEFAGTRVNKKIVYQELWGAISGFYTAADTAPSVYGGVTQLIVTNAGAINLATLADPSIGQRLTLIFTDANTTLKHNTGNIRLIGGADIVGAARKTVIVEYSSTYAQWLEISVAANT